MAPPPVPKAKSEKSGFKFPKILKRGGGGGGSNSNSSTPSKNYGNLDVPHNGSGPMSDTASIASRASDMVRPEEATSGRPQFARASSGATNSDSVKTKRRESLMPFSAGGLFRKGTSKNATGSGGERRTSEASSSFGGGGRGSAAEHGVGSGSFGNGSSNAIDEGAEDGYVPPVPTRGVTNVDEEGYSVPPAGYDQQPFVSSWNGAANLMDDDEDGDEA